MGYLYGRQEPEMFVADSPQSEQVFVADMWLSCPRLGALRPGCTVEGDCATNYCLTREDAGARASLAADERRTNMENRITRKGKPRLRRRSPWDYASSAEFVG